ncbi:MAG: hypothetical protein ABIJ27_01425 [Candidatus Omnitrophota bacterium]
MITVDDFKKLPLRIATIKKADDHPDADRLYVLTIDLGNEERTIVAGIKKSYEKSQLVGKKIAVITNLEPATIRGVISNGMLLAANGESDIAIMVPEKNVETGCVVR